MTGATGFVGRHLVRRLLSRNHIPRALARRAPVAAWEEGIEWFRADVTAADSLRGTLQEFNAIIAVVVGGTLLTGGYGSVVGALFGALIFGMVQQGIIITGVDGDWFRVFVGGVLVLAVIFNNFIRQQAAKR